MTVQESTICGLIQSFPVLLILAQNHNKCLKTPFVYHPPTPTQSPEYYQALDALFQNLYGHGYHHDDHGSHGIGHGQPNCQNHGPPYIYGKKWPQESIPHYGHGHPYTQGIPCYYQPSGHGYPNHGYGFPGYGNPPYVYKKLNGYNLTGNNQANKGIYAPNQVYNLNHKYKIVVKKNRMGPHKRRAQKLRGFLPHRQREDRRYGTPFDYPPNIIPHHKRIRTRLTGLLHVRPERPPYNRPGITNDDYYDPYGRPDPYQSNHGNYHHYPNHNNQPNYPDYGSQNNQYYNNRNYDDQYSNGMPVRFPSNQNNNYDEIIIVDYPDQEHVNQQEDVPESEKSTEIPKPVKFPESNNPKDESTYQDSYNGFPILPPGQDEPVPLPPLSPLPAPSPQFPPPLPPLNPLPPSESKTEPEISSFEPKEPPPFKPPSEYKPEQEFPPFEPKELPPLKPAQPSESNIGQEFPPFEPKELPPLKPAQPSESNIGQEFPSFEPKELPPLKPAPPSEIKPGLEFPSFEPKELPPLKPAPSSDIKPGQEFPSFEPKELPPLKPAPSSEFKPGQEFPSFEPKELPPLKPAPSSEFKPGQEFPSFEPKELPPLKPAPPSEFKPGQEFPSFEPKELPPLKPAPSSEFKPGQEFPSFEPKELPPLKPAPSSEFKPGKEFPSFEPKELPPLKPAPSSEFKPGQEFPSFEPKELPPLKPAPPSESKTELPPFTSKPESAFPPKDLPPVRPVPGSEPTLPPLVPVPPSESRTFGQQPEFHDGCKTVEGQPGTCVIVFDCQPYLELLQQSRSNPQLVQLLRKAHCGFEGNNPKVCCPRPGFPTDPIPSQPPSTTTTTTTTTTTAAPVTEETKQELNGDYVAALPEPPVCGVSNASFSRVVDGVDAKLGDFPWMALLGYKRKTGATSWLCGGSLITAKHVLTAAHCIHNHETDLYVVRVGELDLAREDEGATPLDVLIKTKIKHEQYNANAYSNDIGLLILQKEVPFTDLIRPICIPQDSELRARSYENYNPIIAGWGDIEFHGPSATHLQALQLPVVSNEFCAQAYSAYKAQKIDERVLCAGYKKGGKDACQGDSGGPLMQPIWRNYITHFYQIGVVSFGKKCAEPGFPGVYTRITYFVPWLEKMILGTTSSE